MRINNDNIMYNTIRLIKETVGVPYEYLEDADQCKATIATIYGILLAAEAMEEGRLMRLNVRKIKT